MRRLWMSALLAPVVALAVPAAALAAPSVRATPATPVAGGSLAASATGGRVLQLGGRVLQLGGRVLQLGGRVLQLGGKGLSTRQLQHKLADLKYYPGPINGIFGIDTLEAVWAFQEVQGLPGEDFVSSAMDRALAHPRAPRVLDRVAGPNRIEINLAAEVLVLYRHNRVQLISHVSTGGGYFYCSPGGGCGVAITPTGNFQTLSFFPGWLQVPLGEMYNSVFFIGTAFAIHGDTYVPLAPVSHGCVRIPMDIAVFFHTLVKVPGEPVIVRQP